MCTTNVSHQTVIGQCLDLLKLEDFSFSLFDYRTQKLFTRSAIELFVEAQLNQRQSYTEIAEHLHSNPSLQQIIGLTSISTSQLSRKTKGLPTLLLQQLFLSITQRLNQWAEQKQGVPSPREKYARKCKYNIGKLRVIDSTQISLTPFLGRWAQVSTTKNAVKMHTRFVVADPKMAYPDKIVASTADVSDHDKKVLFELVVPADATYVFDRGYIVYEKYNDWMKQGILFVARIQERNRGTIYRRRLNLDPDYPYILDDMDVKFPKMDKPVRLIEFLDEQGRKYRVITNRWDLKPHEIAEIYRYRWLIELFFKWVKQHARLVKLYSQDPDAIWNQMFLALIAYGLCLLVKLQTQSSKSMWEILRLLRLYATRTWETFLQALFRKPTRTSKGRKKKKGGRARPSKDGTLKKKKKAPKIIETFN